MSFRFHGDVKRLLRMAGRLDKATTEAMDEIVEAAASSMQELVEDGFAKERDPYGKGWAGLACRDGQILRATGDMARSTLGKAEGKTATVSVRPFYASVHQQGMTIKAKNPRWRTLFGKFSTKVTLLTFKCGDRWISKAAVKIPRRMMVPTRSRGLPETWATEFNLFAHEILDELLGGAGG